MRYIKCKEIIDNLNICKNDIILISSDISRLALEAHMNDDLFDPNQFIDAIIEKIGGNGTLLFPTYNWDFCRGIAFDYYKTPCKTGALAKIALNRKDFKRTKHPIYSFAVWGKDQNKLYLLNNKSSFGADSPFAYLYENNAKNLVIDSELKNNFTFVHYVEEQAAPLEYRYIKDFSGGYIDENDIQSNRTYSMFVRNLDLQVVNIINPLESIFVTAGFEKQIKINSVLYSIIDLNGVYDIIMNDIINNNSGRICSYLGQLHN